jgi:hypothetical protein
VCTASIPLGITIQVKGICTTDLDITIPSDSTETKTKIRNYKHSETWEIMYMHLMKAIPMYQTSFQSPTWRDFKGGTDKDNQDRHSSLLPSEHHVQECAEQSTDQESQVCGLDSFPNDLITSTYLYPSVVCSARSDHWVRQRRQVSTVSPCCACSHCQVMKIARPQVLGKLVCLRKRRLGADWSSRPTQRTTS